MAKKVQKKRKKLRLKKSARRTIAALLLVTSIIVAAVPVRDVAAESNTDSPSSLYDSGNAVYDIPDWTEIVPLVEGESGKEPVDTTAPYIITTNTSVPPSTSTTGASATDVIETETSYMTAEVYTSEEVVLNVSTLENNEGIEDQGQGTNNSDSPEGESQNLDSPDNTDEVIQQAETTDEETTDQQESQAQTETEVPDTNSNKESEQNNEQEGGEGAESTDEDVVTTPYTENTASENENENTGTSGSQGTGGTFRGLFNSVSLLGDEGDENIKDNVESGVRYAFQWDTGSYETYGINAGTLEIDDYASTISNITFYVASKHGSNNGKPAAIFQLSENDSSQLDLFRKDCANWSPTASGGTVELGNKVCYMDSSKTGFELKTVYENSDGVQFIFYDAYNSANENLSDASLLRLVASVTDDQGVTTGETFYVTTGSDTIKTIADRAFLGADNLTSISIPDDVVKIGDRAFESCTNLSSVSLGVACESVGKRAFANCSNLGTVDISELSTLKVLGDGAFAGDSRITSLTLNRAATTIGSACFYGTSLNDSLDYDSDTENGIFKNYYNYAGSERIPTTKVTMGSYVFSCDKNLEEMELYDEIVQLGRGTFAGCTKLEIVETPRAGFATTVAKDSSSDDGWIGNPLAYDTFRGCEKLSYVQVRGNLLGAEKGTLTYGGPDGEDEETGDNNGVPATFYIWGNDPGTNNENNVIIYDYALEDEVTYFYYADDIVGGEKHYVKSKDNYIFSFVIHDDETPAYASVNGIEALRKLPPDKTEKDVYSDFTIPTEIAEYAITEVDDGAFKGLTKELQDKYGVSGDYPVTVTVPDAITKIGSSAFEDVTSLEKLIINTKGTDIGGSAFKGCTNLRYVDFTQSDNSTETSSIGSYCFQNCPRLAVVDFRDYDLSKEGSRNVCVNATIGADAFNTGRSTPISISESDPTGDYYVFNSINGILKDSNTLLNYKNILANDPSTYLIIRGAVPINDDSTIDGAYAYALNLDGGTHKASDQTGAYITYTSGDPENITCKYSDNLGKPSLKLYPTANTIVEINDGERLTIGELAVRKKNHEQNPQNSSYNMTGNQEAIVNYTCGTPGVVIPKGVTSIDEAINYNPSTEKTYDYITEVNSASGISSPSTGLNYLTLYNVNSLPTNDISDDLIDLDTAYHGISDDTDLISVVFKNDVADLGSLPFYNDTNLTNVTFNEDTTASNPTYSYYNGIIYSTTGNGSYNIVEVLPVRGKTWSVTVPDATDETEMKYFANVSSMDPGAFMNCDNIKEVNLMTCSRLTRIPEKCFYDCDRLEVVKLPEGVSSILSQAFAMNPETLATTNLSKTINLYDYAGAQYTNPDIFEYVDLTHLYGKSGTNTEDYYDLMNHKSVLAEHHMDEITFNEIGFCTIKFLPEGGGDPIATSTLEYNSSLYKWPTGTSQTDMQKDGYVFLGWFYTDTSEQFDIPYENIKNSFSVIAKYEAIPDNTRLVLFMDQNANFLGQDLYTIGTWIESVPTNVALEAAKYGTVDHWDPIIPGTKIIAGEETMLFLAYYSGQVDPTKTITVTYYDNEKTDPLYYTKNYEYGDRVEQGNIPPEVIKTINSRKGKTFDHWEPAIPYPTEEGDGLTKDVSFYAVYKTNSSTGGGGGGGGSSTSSTSGSSSSKSSSSSSSSRSSSSSGSSSATNSSTAPVAVSGAIAGYTPVNGGVVASNNGGSSGTGTTGGGRAAGNTVVQSTTPGISDTGKMSATVNGSSDSYTLKISETDEANRLAEQALINKYGSLDNIRYLPIDISLYDSTGQNKISPIPAGTSVSVTVPIPDDLAIYGGNAKAAGTEGGVLEELNPRFTVINEVPCMNFTCDHLSPYVIYVDTANLSDPAMMDSTPKTGDMIHPKWFLAIGLFAASIFMFLKRDKEERRVIA